MCIYTKNMGCHFEFKERSDPSEWRRHVTSAAFVYMASKGSGSFCATFGCSNRKGVHKEIHFYRFPKEKER